MGLNVKQKKNKKISEIKAMLEKVQEWVNTIANNLREIKGKKEDKI